MKNAFTKLFGITAFVLGLPFVAKADPSFFPVPLLMMSYLISFIYPIVIICSIGYLILKWKNLTLPKIIMITVLLIIIIFSMYQSSGVFSYDYLKFWK